MRRRVEKQNTRVSTRRQCLPGLHHRKNSNLRTLLRVWPCIQPLLPFLQKRQEDCDRTSTPAASYWHMKAENNSNFSRICAKAIIYNSLTRNNSKYLLRVWPCASDLMTIFCRNLSRVDISRSIKSIYSLVRTPIKEAMFSTCIDQQLIYLRCSIEFNIESVSRSNP